MVGGETIVMVMEAMVEGEGMVDVEDSEVEEAVASGVVSAAEAVMEEGGDTFGSFACDFCYTQ